MSEYADIIGETFASRGQVVGSIGEDPEQAARAVRLSEVSGTAPEVILGDVDGFDHNLRARIASDLVAGNVHLAEYSQNPIAARISNDDWGNLDAVSSSLEKIVGYPSKAGGNVLYGALEGLRKGFGENGIGGWILDGPQGREFNKAYPMSAATLSVVAAPVELTFRSLGALIHAASSGAAAGGEEFYKLLGGSESQAKRFGRDMGGTVEALTAAPLGIHYPVHPTAVVRAKQGIEPSPFLAPMVEQVKTTLAKIAPWVDRGIEPPVGIDPIIDMVKSEQTGLDIANLSETLKEAQLSTTKERSPEMFADFLRQHTDATIGISPDVIMELYGSKLPAIDDGVLGWVPRLTEQMQTALATGTDVQIPLADYLAKIDPGVAKQLEEFTRVRPEGLTKFEIAELPPTEIKTGPELYEITDPLDAKADGEVLTVQVLRDKDGNVRGLASDRGSIIDVAPAYKNLSIEEQIAHSFGDHPQGAAPDVSKVKIKEESAQPIDTVRQAAKLEPVFRDVTLKRVGQEGEAHAFVLIDREGKEVGELYIGEEAGGKRLYVDDILGQVNAFGTKEMRSVLRQLKAEFPNAESIAGDRVSGARGQSDKWKGEGGKVEISLKNVEAAKKADTGVVWYQGVFYDAGDKPISDYWTTNLQKAKEYSGPNGFVFVAKEGAFSKEALQTKQGDILSNKKMQQGEPYTIPDVEVLGKLSREASESEFASLNKTEVVEKEAFEKASAIGMTVDQYKRYMKLIEKRQIEDIEKATKRAEKSQERRLSAEWKAWENELRPEVVREVHARPDIATDRLIREGVLFEESLGKPVKIASEFLTPEQMEALPRNYYAKAGMAPDDIAALTGFDSGGTMLASLIELQKQKAGAQHDGFIRKIISAELERQMEVNHGDLSQNILEAAREQALSETQVQILHEETLHFAEQAGAQFPIKASDLKDSVTRAFEESNAYEQSVDKFMASSGRAGRALENALLKGDAAEAFRQAQRRQLSIMFAREAKELELERASFEKTARTFREKVIKGVDQEYTNFIQLLLQQAEIPIKPSKAEVDAAIEFAGHESLAGFVQHNRDFLGYDPAVSPELQASGPKPLEQLTVAEFRELKDAVDSLNYIGHEIKKINVMGDKVDRAEFEAKVVENLTQLPVRPRDSQGRWLYQIDASLTRMEELVKDFDLRQELGPMFRAVIEPMMQSKAKEFDLVTDLSKFFRETKGTFDKKWRESLNESIPQNFLIDPYYQVPFDLTRENLVNIALNWGTRSNIQKLTQGYASLELGRKATKEEAAQFEVKLKALLEQHLRPEDIQFVNRMLEPFKGWRPMMETVARNTTGVAPKWIEPTAADFPAGRIEGGYWPVKYDRLGSNLAVIEDKAFKDAVFQPSYFRAATAKSHLKERTGYIDFVDISTSIEQAAGTMQQTIHDIAFREALIEAGKVFYSKDIRAAIRKHYGSEYEAQLIPWLKRIANVVPDESALKGYNRLLHRMRVNLIGHALPLNLKVIASPDVGVPNPKAWAEFEANRSENVKLAMEKSNEIRHLVYNMDRDFREQLERTINKGGWEGYQAEVVRWGFVPMMKVSQEFRMSTFVQKYNEGKGKGLSDHEAAVVADSFVRERHGAASVVDLPAVMQGSEWMKSLTMFYGFFNTMYNWQRQIPGNVRRKEFDKATVNAIGSIGVGATFGALLFNQSKENDSWWKIISKALLLQPLSTVPGLREGGSLFFEGFPQRTPLESGLNAVRSLYTDLIRKSEGKPMKKPIQNTANVVGLFTGLPLAQIGRTGEFLYDVKKGEQQQPRNILEWVRGIIHGESKPKR